MSRVCSSRSERGVSLILFALLAASLFIVSALVVDLSFVRQNRQTGKSSADFAATAGVRSLDNGSGEVRTWYGICSARDYLIANDPGFSGMTETYTDAAGNSVGSPCDAPLNGTLCVDSAKTTWGVLVGEVDGGRLQVTIRNGYETPDPQFAEDGVGTYASDVADPCLQLAVVVEEREGAYFGGVAGASEYNTRIRSVARAERGGGGQIAPALILLERTGCAALTSSGTGATIEAQGQGNAPGTIHVDSLASGDCADNNKIFDVDGSPSAPAIRAMRSADGLRPGSITAVALTGAATARPQFTADSPSETCVQISATDCVSSPITGGPITGRNLVTRSVVDTRYITHIRNVRDIAAQRFAWTTDAQAQAAGFTPFGCSDTNLAAASMKIFINCGNNGAWNGSGKTIPDGYEVVIRGSVNLPVNFGNNTKVYVRGNDGSNRQAVYSTNSSIQQNVGSSATCDARYASAPTARSLLVIGYGYLGANGGTVRLCQTTVIMLDNTGSSCPIPSTNGLAPYGNTCRGEVDIGGNAIVDWSAPNVNDSTDATPAQLANFEDLALWSETKGSPPGGQRIGGGGGLDLAGIFFTPNADPVTITGGGTVDLRNAQFVSRRLRATGGGVLTLSPKEPNAVTLPALEGFSLVR